MADYLNQELGFDEVRWLTMRKTSYDALLSFRDMPSKVLLPVGTKLFRLVALAAGNEFDGVWWTPESVFNEVRMQVNSASHGSGRLLRNYIAQDLALPSGDFQLAVLEIQLTRPVYGWKGIASGLFGRPGGKEQIYLPNLGERGDRGQSLHARSNFSYWLRF